jgi:proline dehydrogenase
MALISFDDTRNAFAYKSDKELRKAHFLFSFMDHPLLVKWGTSITPWAIRKGLPVNGLIRGTIFHQFVGGETLEQTAAVAKRLGDYGVQVILDYGVEGGHNGEEGFEEACRTFIRVIDHAATQPNIPFMSIKVTGVARFGLLEKLDHSVDGTEGTLMKRYARALDTLTDDEKAEWQRVYDRLERICAHALHKGIGVMIDAEETWIQDPVDALAMMLMDRFNKKKAFVYNTLQHYRHDRLAFLQDSIEAAGQRGFVLGVKLVRGAYMEKERERATAKGYPSPIQPDKTATDQHYNDAVKMCIDHIGIVSVIIASHNEYSNMYATRLLSGLGLPLSHEHVHFSQLYGMSDNISFNLAKAGCNVSKYLPFGPIRDVIPYLMRRAQENSSVAGQTGRELRLIKKEMQRRKAG